MSYYILYMPYNVKLESFLFLLTSSKFYNAWGLKNFICAQIKQ